MPKRHHVSSEKLEELAEEWRERADTLYDIHKQHGVDNLGQVGMMEMLANEVERLAEDGELPNKTAEEIAEELSDE